MRNFTRIPAPRVKLVDPQTGTVADEWFRFFNNLYAIAYSGAGSTIAGTYGSATAVPQITVDDFAGITAISNVPIAIDANQIVSGTINSARISGAYTGITGVGTLTLGTWNASTIAIGYGGTGLTSYTAGDTLYYATGASLSTLPIGASTYINTSSGTAPQWTNPTTITVGKASNLVGGAVNQIPYQTAADTTGYITAPTVANTFLEWSGTTFQWSVNPLGTVTSVAALTLGTTGTDLSSTVANPTTTPVITLNVPTASSVNRGALSAADWTTFNNKAPGVTFTTNYIPYGQGTTTLNQSAGLQFDGTDFTTTGFATATSFRPSASTVPTNGMYLPAANSVGFATNSTNAIYINSSQNVGIGIASPSGKFNAESFSNGAATTVIVASNGNGQASTNANTEARIYLSGSTSATGRGTYIGGINIGGTVGGNNHALTFATSAAAAAPTERMRIFSTGGVSIGNTTDPGATNLSVTGTTTSTGGIVNTAIGATGPSTGAFTTLTATSNLVGSVNAKAGGLTAVTAVAGSLTLATGGVTIASQVMASGSVWRVTAYGTYAASSSANARTLTMACFWGTTALTSVTTGNVLAVTAQTTPWQVELEISGSSATAAWCTAILSAQVTSATIPLNYTATAASVTALTTTSTLDFRVGQTGTATAGDTINVHSVILERIK